MKLYEDLKILVVDDQDQFINGNIDKLIELGFDKSLIKFAMNGEEALKLAQEEQFEFLIIDLVMPKMDGLELLKRLRSMENYKSIPILVLSGSFDKSIVLEVNKAGATSFMVKPPEVQMLAIKMIECSQRTEV